MEVPHEIWLQLAQWFQRRYLKKKNTHTHTFLHTRTHQLRVVPDENVCMCRAFRYVKPSPVKYLRPDCATHFTLSVLQFIVWNNNEPDTFTCRFQNSRFYTLERRDLYALISTADLPVSSWYTHLPITRMRNRVQYRMSIRGVSGLTLEESTMHIFSRIKWIIFSDKYLCKI